MGILDEAIREHLELKRQHGADESELKGLEDEAFGEAERPDATGSTAGEAETQIISPGSSLTTPAGEGDQLDKVFEAKRQAEATDAATEAKPKQAEAAADAPAEPEATFAEHPIPDPPAPAEPEVKAEPEATEAATVESPEAKPSEPAPEAPEPADEGDAGDMLEAERHHLSSHPTEHYDVDAAIAEEDEIDILSESSLSDELDRALESTDATPAGGETAAPVPASEPDSAEIDLDEPDSAEFETETDSAELLYEDAATENQPVEKDEPVEGGEPETGEEEGEGSSEFFDQDDPLEATPDFLEETPEHDRLWFEQKEPKDFDFGD